MVGRVAAGFVAIAVVLGLVGSLALLRGLLVSQSAQGPASGVSAGPADGDSEVPADLAAAVNALFEDGTCVTAAEAQNAIAGTLDAGVDRIWSIEPSPGADNGCVVPGFIAAQHLIVLMHVDTPTLADAMHAVADELMSRCLGEQETRGLLSSTLTALGVSGWSISTDGPLAYPGDREEEVRQHIATGCFVYSASSPLTDSQPVLYIYGRQG